MLHSGRSFLQAAAALLHALGGVGRHQGLPGRGHCKCQGASGLGLGFRVQGLGFRLSEQKFRVWTCLAAHGSHPCNCHRSAPAKHPGVTAGKTLPFRV